jgi:hypothetical protein
MDRRLVVIMAEHGFTQGVIASLLGIDRKTLRKYYRDELDHGSARFYAALVINLWRLAQQRNGVGEKAIEFILRCRFSWSRALAF